MTDPRPLFIPLRAEHYDAYASGANTTEYRRYGPGWNTDTCTIGRAVTLSKGYGKAHRLGGRIVGFDVVRGVDLNAATRGDGSGAGVDRLHQLTVRAVLAGVDDELAAAGPHRDGIRARSAGAGDLPAVGEHAVSAVR